MIIPTYNRKDLLKQALESILMQDYPKSEFEIVVVNDGSSDSTRGYLKSVVDTNKAFDIKVINQNKNYGVAHSRNIAIKNASGEIIAFIDDDCVADINWLKTLDEIYSLKPELMSVGVKLISAYPNSIIARYVYNFHVYAMNTGFIPVDGLSEIMKKFDIPGGDCNVHGCGAGHNSYRKKVFHEIGFFDEKFVCAEDMEFNLRFQRHYGSNQIYFTNKSSVKHYYKTSYFGLLKQFFNYGQGGYKFRKTRSKLIKEKPFGYTKVYTIKFIIAISLYTKRNTFEFIILLFIAVTSHLCLLLGEVYKTFKEAFRK